MTLDTDLGIALGADLGQYGSLQMNLQAQGFRLSKDEFGGPRFVKTVGDFTIPLDFLTERPPATTGTAMVADVPANILPGINRALASARNVVVKGVDLQGAQQALTVRVCEAGPFLAMKLRAFAWRQAPKDAFDILYLLLHYDRGTNAAAAAFGEEVRASNPAVQTPPPVWTSIFETSNLPLPSALRISFWDNLHRASPTTFGFDGCKSSRTWWMPGVSFGMRFPHDRQ